MYLYLFNRCYCILIFFVISWSIFALAQKNCSVSDFQCLDGECIELTKKCNAIADCKDSSDETIEACKLVTCSNKQFHCAYGACVSINSLCDGIKNCADNSDEVQCPMFDTSNFCTQTRTNEENADVLNPSWMVPCFSGDCVPLLHLCDGVQHCPDNSDEIYQTCQYKGCPRGTFKCNNGECIPEENICDGELDCLDNSDETVDLCGSGSKTKTRNICGKQFKCVSGFCIEPNLVCNGKRDCDDGSDETYQQCKNVLCDGFHCKYGGCVNINNIPRNLSETSRKMKPLCVDSSDLALLTSEENTKKSGPCTKREDSSDYCHCIVPPQPSNGFLIMSTSARNNLLYPGSTIIYFCDENFALNSEISLTCLQNGTWNGTIPKCLPKCELLHQNNVEIKCLKDNKRIPCEKQLPDGAKIRANCKKNYQDKYAMVSHRILTCKDGSWDNDLPDCNIVCGTRNFQKLNSIRLKRDVYSNASYGEYPWHLALYRKMKDELQIICGGILIAPRFALTAAHCIWDNSNERPYDLSKNEYIVSAGKLDRDMKAPQGNEQFREVLSIVAAEEFHGDKTFYAGDIALLLLSKPFEINNIISPICIDTVGDIQNGIIAGWNFSTPSSNDKLTSTTVRHVEKEVCFFEVPSSFIKFTIFKLCGKFVKNPICYGNSGSGWTTQKANYNFVQGILSVAPQKDFNSRDSCGIDSPVVFTSIYHHRNWLQKSIKKFKIAEMMQKPALFQTNRRNCILDLPPINGKYKVNDLTSLQKGDKVSTYSVIQFRCDKGYTISDNKPVVCIDGQWSRSYPTCQKTCPPLISTSVIIKCEFNNIEVPCDQPMLPDTIAHFRCKDAYDVQPPPTYSTSKCFDGAWDYPLYTCFPVCGIKVPEGQKFIIGGNDTSIGDFPWHVGLYQELISEVYNQICGGTIISPRLVISAAHCFVFSRNPENYAVAAGKYYRQWKHPKDIKAQYVMVYKIVIPDRYQAVDNSFAYDIAVLILKNQFILSHLVRPICMDWSNQYDDYQLSKGANGYVAGWGLTTEGGDASEELKTIELPYIPFRECYDNSPSDFRPFITNDKFCAGHLTGHAVCEGDSGGGLTFVKDFTIYYLRGIVSVGPQKGSSCDANRYTAFTRISAHIKWIISVDNSNRLPFLNS